MHQRAAKLVESISMIAQLYGAAVLGRFVKIKCRFHLFGLNWLGAQCAYKRGSVVILIVLTLVLFPPLNCTHVLAHLEINSTSWKNSKKNRIQIYMHTCVCAVRHSVYTCLIFQRPANLNSSCICVILQRSRARDTRVESSKTTMKM